MKKQIKKILPRTLFARSLMILVTPILLIQIVTMTVFLDNHWKKMIDRLAFSVAGELAMLSEQIEQAGPQNQQAINVIKSEAARHLDMVVSYSETAQLNDYEGSDGDLWGSIIAGTLGEKMEQYVRRPYLMNVDVEEKWIEISIQLEEGVMIVSVPQRRLFSSSGYIFLLWMMGASFILLITAILFMRGQIRPIRRLAVVAERVGKGQSIPERFKPEGAREVRQATRAILEMHDRIQRQVEQRTAMLAGVSHDLRTPLTRMKLQAAMLADNPDVTALRNDIQDMERMIDGYLDFVRGSGREEASRVDLLEILDRVVKREKRSGFKINFDQDDVCNTPITISVRPIAFERCLNNIISNAKSYAESMVVSVQTGKDSVTIDLDDDGPGIPENNRDDVFRPFFRGDHARNLNTGNIGLGLSVVQDIILMHGGSVELLDSPMGGLRVRLSIPI